MQTSKHAPQKRLQAVLSCFPLHSLCSRMTIKAFCFYSRCSYVQTVCVRQTVAAASQTSATAAEFDAIDCVNVWTPSCWRTAEVQSGCSLWSTSLPYSSNSSVTHCLPPDWGQSLKIKEVTLSSFALIFDRRWPFALRPFLRLLEDSWKHLQGLHRVGGDCVFALCRD